MLHICFGLAKEALPQVQESDNVPTHVVTLTQVGTSIHLGQTHLGTPFQVPAWVRKLSLGSTGDQIFSLIIIQSLFVQQVSGVMVSNIFEIVFFLDFCHQYA